MLVLIFKQSRKWLLFLLKGDFKMRRRLFEYPDVITIKELMEILGIGRNKAYELLKSGKIVSFKEGKK